MQERELSGPKARHLASIQFDTRYASTSKASRKAAANTGIEPSRGLQLPRETMMPGSLTTGGSDLSKSGERICHRNGIGSTSE